MRIRERLEKRRDPLRLKEHLFWLMWHYWLRADFEQCVATCNEGIALSAQLGSPPVQYASIKGLALTDLGRFDEAWASFQEEVADDAHPFGRCMRELGTAMWLETLGALDRAEATAKEVLEEAGRLSRVWMQRAMVDLLTIVGARRGVHYPEVAGWDEKKAGLIDLRLVPLAAAAAALARRDFAQALVLADQSAEETSRLGLRRARIIALELATRALAGLERWDELLAHADAALAESEADGLSHADVADPGRAGAGAGCQRRRRGCARRPPRRARAAGRYGRAHRRRGAAGGVRGGFEKVHEPTLHPGRMRTEANVRPPLLSEQSRR